MNINELTLGKIKDLQNILGGNQVTQSKTSPYNVGEKRLIRTVTMIYTGEIVALYDQEIVLKDAAWIASTGRWNENLISCSFDEVEPYPIDREVIVHKGGILDSVEIDALPKDVK